MPAARLAWWERQCEAALKPTWHSSSTESGTRPPRWLLPLLWTGVALCVLGLVASFAWSPSRSPVAVPDPAAVRVRGAPLPPAAPPAAPFDADFALRNHRDLPLLAGAVDALRTEQRRVGKGRV